MMSANELPMIASSEDWTIAAKRDFASSASLCSVMSSDVLSHGTA
jgi:hypothetical protein